MTLAITDSPLLQMVRETATDYWNDSCSVSELKYAVERGATGSTSNPTIVHEVLNKEAEYWVPRVQQLAVEHPTWSEVELTWALVEEMARRGAAVLQPVFEREAGKKGRLSIQLNPANYRDADRMVEQAERFHRLAPNMIVKFPSTAAGIVGLEEATYRGISTNATVNFTLPQAVAVAEAVGRGIERRERAGLEIGSIMHVCTIMVGRLDDWVKVLVERDDIALDPGAANWAGIAVFKRAYALFQERGYRPRLLAAAYRHRLHWTELVGGDVVLTMPHAWQVRFNRSGITPEPRMHLPVDQAIVDDLLSRVPDFRRAYEPDGMAPAEFEAFGASVRTLRSFIDSYHKLMAAVRDLVLPDPDRRPG